MSRGASVPGRPALPGPPSLGPRVTLFPPLSRRGPSGRTRHVLCLSHAGDRKSGSHFTYSPWDSACHLVYASKLSPPGTPGNSVFSNYPRRRVHRPAAREPYAHVLPYFSCRKARLFPDPMAIGRPSSSLAWLLLRLYFFFFNLLCGETHRLSCLVKSSAVHPPGRRRNSDRCLLHRCACIES